MPNNVNLCLEKVLFFSSEDKRKELVIKKIKQMERHMLQKNIV